FIKVGRMPFDALNTTGIQMPPKGGNPLFKDEDLFNIVSYVRTFKAPEGVAPGSDGTATTTNAPAPKEEFYITKSTIPNAFDGPTGLKPDRDCVEPVARHAVPVDPRRDPERPINAHLFFSIYFMMTGLHGLHVLAGMGCISWLLVRAWLGHFTSMYFT